MCPVNLPLIVQPVFSEKMQVRYSNAISSQFTVGKRGSAGDVLSLILFIVYINYFYLINIEQQLRRRLFYCLNVLAQPVHPVQKNAD